jgi:hypothetical protein
MNIQIKLDENCKPISESGQPHVFTYDPASNLLWLYEDAHPEEVTAEEADQIVSALRAGGFDDWRLGDDVQLSGRVDRSLFNPAANTEFDRVKSDWYWTSTRAKWNASMRWCVFFNLGVVNYLHVDYTARVRAVRSWAGPSPAGQ